MPNRKIKAVLFDFGETLLTFGRVNTLHLFRQGARLSYNYLKDSRQPIGNFQWYLYRSLLSLWMHSLASNITGSDFDSLALLKKTGIKKGICLDDQQWEKVACLWYEPLSRIAKVEPDIAETLNTLKNLGLKLGLVSNTFVPRCCLEKHLAQYGILDFFELRLYSYQVGFRKPDTKIFRTAAAKIGELPENIMFVGDRLDNDIKPALKLGMSAVMKKAYTNTGVSLPAGVKKITHLSELPALIKEMETI